jgi:gas vesicle protein
MVVKFFIGFLLGLIIGASVGLAFAPEPGARTRAKVMERMKERGQGSPMERTTEEMEERFE